MKKTNVLIAGLLGICIFPASAVTFDPNDIYISTFGDGVLRYDLQTRSYVEHTVPANVLANVMGIAFAPDGKLWACDAYGYVKRFDESGLVGTLPFGLNPEFITFGPDGNAYVSYPWNGDGEIRKFNGTTGAPMPMGTFIDFSTGIVADAWRCHGLDFGPDGNLYINVSVNRDSTDYTEVHKFDPTTGAWLGKFADVGAVGSWAPKDIAFGRRYSQRLDSEYTVSEFYNNKIYRYDSLTSMPKEQITVNRPRGVVYGPDGSLYITNELQGYVVRFHIYEGRTTDFLSGILNPQYLAFIPSEEELSPECGTPSYPYPVGDVNRDCIVDFKDLAMVLKNWLGCTHPDDCG